MVFFPVFKIGILLIKQISKPIANYVKQTTVNHPSMRKTIIKFAQKYHRFEVKLNRRQLDITGNYKINELEEGKALDLAANFIGESVLFTIAAGTLTVDYIRSKASEKEKENNLNNRFEILEERIKILESKK